MPPPSNRVSALYGAALERSPDERDAFLREACAGDDALRREVESLLSFEPASSGFLERPAIVPPTMVGRQLGPYTIVAPLGTGGMGEVYRARDSKLGRDVAIKFLPPHFTEDLERRARFAREARLLASLNHPNIGAIYGFEEADGTTGLVLELVEGPTLAERLARGPLALTEAFAVARQIADAMEAAHERGVVHRDLKPANIVLQGAANLSPEALRVKVLDFGLAKSIGAGLDGDGTGRPNESRPGTADGRILGTPSYMSPEQARGLPVDRRTDIWAFGCVLYEMLTGRQAFPGDTISDTFVNVLEHEPDWSALPASTPANVRTLIERCLRKDPRKRLHDIADGLLEIEDGDSRAATPEPIRDDGGTAPRRTREWVAWGVVAALGLTLAGAVLIPLLARRTASPAAVDVHPQFEVVPPPPSQLTPLRSFALSPDGRHLAFVVIQPDGHAMLWIRPLESLDMRVIAGTNDVSSPFWKPDSSEIGFFADGMVKTVPLSGGPPVPICPGFGQGAWSQDDVIVFGGNLGVLWGSPLQRVGARGGTPAPITSLTGDDWAHGFPGFLPDGEHFIYLAQSPDSSELRVGSLRSDKTVSVGRFESNAQYAAGQLLSLRAGNLVAQPFDPGSRTLIGSPSIVAPGVGYFGARGFFSASVTGTLAYTVGPIEGTLTWLDRNGNVVSRVGSYALISNLDLSPDGRYVAVSKASEFPGTRPQIDIWRIDLERSGLATRLTDHPGNEWDPDWSPDGRQIAFTRSAEPGQWHSLFVRPPDSSGDETPLWKTGNDTGPDWSHDGRFIMYTEDADKPGDLWILPLTGERKPTPFLKTKHSEWAASFSPDDRWVAYQSDASGRSEVYVRPFPVGTGEFQVSRDGGKSVRWRGDGRELFFVAPDGTMMAAAVDTTHGFAVAMPQKLFLTPIRSGPRGDDKKSYIVSKDGQRFLMSIVQPRGPIVVLTNGLARVTKQPDR